MTLMVSPEIKMRGGEFVVLALLELGDHEGFENSSTQIVGSELLGGVNIQ